jgi:hypothetical protein
MGFLASRSNAISILTRQPERLGGAFNGGAELVAQNIATLAAAGASS